MNNVLEAKFNVIDPNHPFDTKEVFLFEKPSYTRNDKHGRPRRYNFMPIEVRYSRTFDPHLYRPRTSIQIRHIVSPHNSRAVCGTWDLRTKLKPDEKQPVQFWTAPELYWGPVVNPFKDWWNGTDQTFESFKMLLTVGIGYECVVGNL